MTTQTTSRTFLPAAALVVLALFGTACDPEAGGATGAPAGNAAAPASSAPVAPTSASPTSGAPTSAAPSTDPATASPSPTDPATTGNAAPPNTAAGPAPAATRTTAAPRSTPKAPTTTATRAAGGSCAHHTTGTCGWDAGLTPVSSSEMAQCADGTASYSTSFSGTCSHHGGVRYWFK